MVLMRSVRKIESGDVHTGAEELLHHGNRARSRAQSADDLRLGAHIGGDGSLFSIGDVVVIHLSTTLSLLSL